MDSFRWKNEKIWFCAFMLLIQSLNLYYFSCTNVGPKILWSSEKCRCIIHICQICSEKSTKWSTPFIHILTNIDDASTALDDCNILTPWFTWEDGISQPLEWPYTIIWRHQSCFLNFSHEKLYMYNLLNIYIICKFNLCISFPFHLWGVKIS